MSDVTPILRSKPILVEPGQTPEDAEWHAGWNAAQEAQQAVLLAAYERGVQRGVGVAQEAGPTWANMGVCCALTFVAGFSVALGYFG